MKTIRIIALAVLIVGSGLALYVARAQQPGIRRTDLQRHDLSSPGREVVQVRVDFDPGAAFGKHSHPGEEIVYATQALCTHRQGELSKGKLNGSTVTCPKHGAQFNVISGAVLRGPAEYPLKTYAVIVDGDIGRVEAEAVSVAKTA